VIFYDGVDVISIDFSSVVRVFLILLIVSFLIWQFLRLTLWLLLFFVLFFVLLIGFDIIGVFSWIQDNILSLFL